MTQNSDKSLEEICEALDNLAIKNLELIEEKVLLTVTLEKLLHHGRIYLAEARYIRGKENIGILQIPSGESEIKTLFDLQTTYIKSRNDETEIIPHFDISLKKREEGAEELQNPIKWFGVLVPQSLRSAQKFFQDALYNAVRLANVKSELIKTAKELDSLKVLKTEVA